MMIHDTSIATNIPAIDSDAFRNVMRTLAGTVTVISTENEGVLYGFTATAVCSVCAEPPTILIAVNRSARTHAHIARKSAFVVNIMADDQRCVAEQFSTKADDVFTKVPHRISENGVPVIMNSAAALECRVDQVVDVGTHSIFFGSIAHAETSSKAPLIYYDGKYGAFEFPHLV